MVVRLRVRGRLVFSDASTAAGRDFTDDGMVHEDRGLKGRSRQARSRNEEQQLRLGLGQVLRYRNLLADGGRRVQAVLAIEHEPSDARWAALRDELAVRLTWPPSFPGAF